MMMTRTMLSFLDACDSYTLLVLIGATRGERGKEPARKRKVEGGRRRVFLDTLTPKVRVEVDTRASYSLRSDEEMTERTPQIRISELKENNALEPNIASLPSPSSIHPSPSIPIPNHVSSKVSSSPSPSHHISPLSDVASLLPS